MKNLISLILIAGLFVACNNKNNMNEGGNAAGNTTMADNSAGNQARMQAFYDQVINGHNIAMVDSFTTADFVDHNPGMGHSGKGIKDTKSGFQDFFTMYPDIHVKTNFMITKGDTIVAYVTMTGTNSGSVPAMPATNKAINIDGVDIVVIKDGKATERWGYFDDMKMMQQLGMMPDMSHMNQKMAEQNKAEGPMEKAGKKMDKGMQKMGVEKKK